MKPEIQEDFSHQLTCRAVEGGYLLRLQRGTRVMETLREFIKTKQIAAGVVSAIGAVEDVELGYFRLTDKQYLRKHFSDIYELVSFAGNISYVKDEPFIHAHAVLSDPDYRPIAGHFFDGTVAVTMEVFLRVFEEKITRSLDDETGLNLLDLS